MRLGRCRRGRAPGIGEGVERIRSLEAKMAMGSLEDDNDAE